MGTTIDKCRICKHAFTTGKDRWYCKKSLADKDDCGEYEMAIKALEQEPKTGHWIENAPEYQNIDPPYICSECGNMHLRKTNYCDQCGCRMVES